MLNQLTIRYDDDVEQAIEREAKSKGISRNRAALRLLRRGAGLEKEALQPQTIGDSLDWFIGSVSEQEARDFQESLKVFDTIDEELWK